MIRTFKTGTSRETTGEKRVTAYFVTDAHNSDEIKHRPEAVTFPVSQVYDQDMQFRRADDYCNYLNKLAEAAQEAYEQNQLINVLKA